METTVPPVEETWNLGDLFADDDAFERHKREFQENLLSSVDGFEGRLVESAATLADALDAVCRAREQLQLLHCYASMRSDGDTRVSACQAMRREVELLSTDLSKRLAFLNPEILATDPQTIEAFLDAEPRLAPYAHFLRDLMRQREHVLSLAEERIIAEAGLVRRDAGSLYQVLTNAELPRPEVTLEDGETVRLTPVAFQKHRRTMNRPDRQTVFPEYFRAYSDFKETLGHNLYSSVKSHLFRSRVRGYDSCLEAALDPDHVPESVYRNLIRQVRENLPVLHRYFGLRARILGLERLEYSDLYCPLGSTPPRRYSVDEARRLVLDGLGPLGADYREALESAFGSRWIDWHPSPGKRSGAYANGWAYGVHPYVMLNFNEDYESVQTLAHEMGHALHSYYSNRTQPFPTADYVIFVAEVASTFNEALLRERVIEAAASREEKLFLLGSYLDGIRGTLFRQTMFAEFELEIHRRAEEGDVLTGDRLDELYLDLLRQYHGHDEGVMRIGEEFAVEWASIPHMYFDFYVYQYATGIVAATALARAVIEERPGARERYLEFLQSGGSDYPLELLRRAGVDLEQADPYRETFAAVGQHLDLLEEWLDPAEPV